jgi:hypothetical protein
MKLKDIIAANDGVLPRLAGATSAYTNPVSIIDHDELGQSVVVTTEFTINEGDLVFWDAVNFTARPCIEPKDVETGKTAHNSEGLIGCAVGGNKPEVYGGGETLEPPMAQVPVLCKAIVFLQATNGQTYKPYEKVTLGADAQTISNAGVTANNLVGYVIVDPPAVPRPGQATPVPEEIVGTTGLRIRVLLAPKFAPAAAI